MLGNQFDVAFRRKRHRALGSTVLMPMDQCMDGTTYRPSRPLILGSIVVAVLLGSLALVFLVSLFVTLLRGDLGDAAFAGFE
jgi:hypothetical protein